VTYRKFKNVKSGGFDSIRERKRYQELVLMEKLGLISDLKTQVKVEVIPKQDGERAAHYIMDFQYVEKGEEIWEDVKGFKTPDYILKRKLCLLLFGKKIRET
jgi:hypothetical protein